MKRMENKPHNKNRKAERKRGERLAGTRSGLVAKGMSF
jgi:hypothetical protein